MNDLAPLTRLIAHPIRYSTIIEVQMKPPSVRVTTGRLTDSWLP